MTFSTTVVVSDPSSSVGRSETPPASAEKESLRLTAKDFLDKEISIGFGQRGSPRGFVTVRGWLESCRQPPAEHQQRYAALQAAQAEFAVLDPKHAAILAAKGNLPWGLPAFRSWDGRRGEGCRHTPTYLVPIDLDGLPDYATAAARRDAWVRDNPAVVAGKVSSSGRGVHFLVAVEPPPGGKWRGNAQHHAAVLEAWAVLDLPENPDPSAKNLTRILYNSYDPEAAQKLEDAPVVPIPWQEIPPLPKGARAYKPTARGGGSEVVDAFQFLFGKFPAGTGSRHNWLAAMVAGLSLGLAQGLIDDFCESNGRGAEPRTAAAYAGMLDDPEQAAVTICGLAQRLGWENPALRRRRERESRRGKETEPVNALREKAKQERERAQDALIEAGWVLNDRFQAVPGSVLNAGKALALIGQDQAFWLNDWDGSIYRERKGAEDEPYNDKKEAGSLRLAIELAVGRTLGYAPTAEALHGAITAQAEARQRNPVVDYLRGLEPWDGVDRLADLAHYLFGVEQDGSPEYRVQSETAVLLIAGVVGRALFPGAHFPYCPIIFSQRQGTAKSDLLKAISPLPEGFAEGVALEGFDYQKKLQERGLGKSVLEIGEINTLGGKTLANLKALVTDDATTNREAYARETIRRPFTFIMVGTTNRRYFLTDEYNRRFPVITVPEEVDMGWLREQREQLFAQAVDRFDRGFYTEGHGRVAIRMDENLWQAANDLSAKHVVESMLGVFLHRLLEEGPEGPLQVISSEELRVALSRPVVGTEEGEDGVLAPGFGRLPSTQELSEEMQKAGFVQCQSFRKRAWKRGPVATVF